MYILTHYILHLNRPQSRDKSPGLTTHKWQNHIKSYIQSMSNTSHFSDEWFSNHGLQTHRALLYFCI